MLKNRFHLALVLLVCSMAIVGCCETPRGRFCRRHLCYHDAPPRSHDASQGIAACDAAAPILFHPVPTRPVFGPRADSRIEVPVKFELPPSPGIETLPPPATDNPQPSLESKPSAPALNAPSALGQAPRTKPLQ